MSARVSAGDSEVDLVILGGGGAGLCAALSAAENGCRNIAVLEKRVSATGNSGMGGGPFAAESPVQRRQGIDAPRDKYFKAAMSFANWKINPRIVRAFVDKSGDTIRWLEELGVKFQPLPSPSLAAPDVQNETPLPRRRSIASFITEPPITYHVPEGEGAMMMQILRQACNERGIRILVHTKAEKILTDNNGRISGILASSLTDGIRFAARAVIIATGGYGDNKELLKKHCPIYREGMEYLGVPLLTGDGLIMATEVGAAVENAGTLLLEGPLVSTSILLNIVGEGGESIKVPLVALAWEPTLLWVNKNGERFITEDDAGPFNGGNAVAMQPGNTAFVLFDAATVQRIAQRGGLRGTPQRNAPLASQLGPLPNLHEELICQAETGRMKISESLKEIAHWIGADPAVLKAAIDEYNAACDEGHDRLFAKQPEHLIPVRTPPFYALKCSSAFLDTIGGIKINERMEVISQTGKPIIGLYAAGVIAGGWEGETYCPYLLGSARGFALSSGRIAGKSAAKFLRSASILEDNVSDAPKS
jgi:fumarate reductase flavoprotein subunit